MSLVDRSLRSRLPPSLKVIGFAQTLAQRGTCLLVTSQAQGVDHNGWSMAYSTKVIAIHFGVMIPLQAFSVTVGLLRLYTRIFITRLAVGIEEWCVAAAMVLAGACALAVAVSDIHFGEGVNFSNSGEQLHLRISLYQIQWSCSVVYAVENFFIKTSILLLYRRIFTVPLFEKLCAGLLYFNAATSTANILAFAFICQPVQHFWQQLIPGTPGKCLSFRAVWIAFGGVNILTDFAAVLLPIPVLRGLHTQKRKRQFLMCIFALSSIPCIASIIRIWTLRHITPHNLGHLIWEHDLWCGIEMTLGTTCACLPTLTPFAARYFPGLLEGAGISVTARRRYVRVERKKRQRRRGGRDDAAATEEEEEEEEEEAQEGQQNDSNGRRRHMRGGTSETVSSPATSGTTSTLARKLGFKVGEGAVVLQEGEEQRRQQQQQQQQQPKRASKHYWWWRANNSLFASEAGEQSQLATGKWGGGNNGGEWQRRGMDTVVLSDLPPVVDVEVGSGRGSLRLDLPVQRLSRFSGLELSRNSIQELPATSLTQSQSTMAASSTKEEERLAARSQLEGDA